MNPFLPEEWRVESLRLTLFTTPEPVDTRDWWDSSVGQPALETASNRMGGETTSSGTLAGQALQLVVRYVWACGPRVRADAGRIRGRAVAS